MKEYEKAVEHNHNALKIRMVISGKYDPETISSIREMECNYKYLMKNDESEFEKVLNELKIIYNLFIIK